MFSSHQLKKIRELAGSVVGREGCELYDLEWLAGPRILRLSIDKADGGATLENCANVSRGLNFLLDVEDSLEGGRYELEVSTPGLERRLTQAWHFDRAVGKDARLKVNSAKALSEGVEPPSFPRSMEGRLVSTTEETLVLKVGPVEWEVPKKDVESGRLVFSFGKKEPSKPSQGVRRKQKKRKM